MLLSTFIWTGRILNKTKEEHLEVYDSGWLSLPLVTQCYDIVLNLQLSVDACQYSVACVLSLL